MRAMGLFLQNATYVEDMRYFLRHTILAASLALGLILSPLSGALSADAVLDSLFSSLQEITDKGDANRIVSEIWTRWSTHPTQESLTTRLIRGASMMNQGDYVHAEAIFSNIITEDPSFAEAWNKRATLFYIQGKIAQSRADIAQTLALEPRHFGALAGLGMIELSAGNLEAALRAYEQAVAVNPHMQNANDIIKELSEKLRGIAL